MVLAGNGTADVPRHEPPGGQLFGVEPGPQRIITLAEQQDVAHSVAPQEFVTQADRRVVAHEDVVVAAVGREQLHGQKNVGRPLLDRDALLLDDGRQERHRQLHAVLGLHDSEIGIGTDLEGERENVSPVVGRLRLHVEQLVDTVDLLLDRRAHRV